MVSPLKEQPIESTDENVKLGLSELQKLGWIEAWWVVTVTARGATTKRYFIQASDQTTELNGPQQVAIWIDGFVAGKGGLG